MSCKGCLGECCQGKGSNRKAILLKEDWGKYDEYVKDGVHYLNTKENDDCVYYSPEGCSIHDTRPVTCRSFFCWQLLPEGLPEHVKKEALKRI